MAAEQNAPLFAGLNDQSITEIPKRREAALHDQRRAAWPPIPAAGSSSRACPFRRASMQ